MSYALIDPNGIVAEIAAEKFEVHQSLSWADLTGVSPTPAVGWPASLQTGGSWTFAEPAPDPAASVLALKAAAKAALDASDLTLLRCVENAVPVPAEWRSYRIVLRQIVSTGAGAMPACPAFPAGT
jgi:hypothetical protein